MKLLLDRFALFYPMRIGEQCVQAWIDAHPEMRRRDESPGLPREAAAR
jgi:hypothetical protein